MLATAGPREAVDFSGLAAWDWKRRIRDDLHEHALQEGTASPEEGTCGLWSLGRQMGLQACDAVTQTLRLAPNDTTLLQVVHSLSEELERFANSTSEQLIQFRFVSAGQPAPAPPKTFAYKESNHFGNKVLKRLRWQLPSDHLLAQAARENVQTLREQGAAVEQIWDWINGKRTVREIWARAQISADMDSSHLQVLLGLLESEGLVVEVAHPVWLPEA